MYNENAFCVTSVASEVIVGVQASLFWSTSALASQTVKELDSELMCFLIF